MERGGSFQKPPPPVAAKPPRSKSTTERPNLHRSNAEDSETSLSGSSTSGDPATYDEFIQSKGMKQGGQEYWMSSLDTWKLRRRNVTQSALERKASREEVEENEQSKHKRRSKTYQEMMEGKEKREKILMKMASQHISLEPEDVVHILTKPSLYEEDDDESKDVAKNDDEVFTSLPPVHDDAESDESSKQTLHDNEQKGPETHVPSYHYQGVKPVAWTPQKKRVSLGILGRLAAFNKGESDDHEKPQSVPSVTSRVAKLTLAQDSEQEREAPSQMDSPDNSESIPAPQSKDQSQSQGYESSANYRPVKFIPKRHSVPSFTSRLQLKPFKTQSMDDTSVEDTKPDMKQHSLKKGTDFNDNSSESDQEPDFNYPGAPAGQQVDDSVPLSTRKTFRVEEEKKRLERLHAEQDRIRQEQYQQEQRRLREQQENGLLMAGREGSYKVEETQNQLERSKILKEPITQEKQREVPQKIQPHVGLDQNEQEKGQNENKQRQGKDDHFQQQIKEERKSEEMLEEAERRGIAEKTRSSYPHNPKMAAIPGRDVDLEPVIEKRLFAPVASSAPAYQRDKSPTQISMDVNREKDLQNHPQLSEEMGNERNWAFNVGVEATQKTEQNILEKANANKQMFTILREEEIERIRAEEKEKLQKEWEELLRERVRQEERERLEQERLEQLRAEQERLRRERIKMEQQQERPTIHSTSYKTDADHLYSSSERLSSKNRQVVEKGGSNVENEDRQQFRVIMSQEKTGIKEQFSENNNKGSYNSGRSHVKRIQGGQMETRHWLVEEAERRRIAEKTQSSYPHDPKMAAIHGRDVDLEPVVEKKIFAPVASSAPAYRRDKSPTQISRDINRSHEKDLQHHPQIPSHVSRDLPPQRVMKTSKFEAEPRKLPPGHVGPDARIQPKQPLSAPGRTSAFKQPTKSSTGARSVSGKVRCSECGKSLNRGAAMIIESLDLYFHIDCFKCCVCNIQLGNGTKGTDVRIRASKLHCQNCYSSEAGFEFTEV